MSDITSSQPGQDSTGGQQSGSCSEGTATVPAGFAHLHIAVLMLIVAAVAFSYAFTPLRSSQDEWWHLKTGQWILEQGKIPELDIFTYTGENIPWHNHEWLSQVIFYKVYELGERGAIGGVRALILFKALIVAGTFLRLMRLLYDRCGAWPIAFLLALVAAEVSRRTIYPRPPIFSYLLFTHTLMLLYGWKAGKLSRRILWSLVPLTALWSNLHGMCLLGIIAVAAFAGGEILENILQLRRNAESNVPRSRCIITTNVLFLSCLTIVLIGAAMANPSGYHIFFLGEKFMNDPLLKHSIAEMMPPPFMLQKAAETASDSGYHFIPGFATFWVAAFLFVVFLVINRLRLPVGADYLLGGFFLIQGLLHWRLLPLFAIAVMGPLAWLLVERSKPLSTQTQRRFHTSLIAFGVVFAGYFVFVNREPHHTFFDRNQQLASGHVMEQAEYPEPLMKFIIATDLPDRMFSQVNYCGYFIWRLSPEHHKLFTDNRFDVFGGEFSLLENIVLAGAERGQPIAPGITASESWNEILDRYGINFVVIESSQPVVEKLRSAGWKRIYYYRFFDVWLRNKPEFADVLTRARINFRRTSSPGAQLPEGLL